MIDCCEGTQSRLSGSETSREGTLVRNMDQNIEEVVGDSSMEAMDTLATMNNPGAFNRLENAPISTAAGSRNDSNVTNSARNPYTFQESMMPASQKEQKVSESGTESAVAMSNTVAGLKPSTRWKMFYQNDQQNVSQPSESNSDSLQCQENAGQSRNSAAESSPVTQANGSHSSSQCLMPRDGIVFCPSASKPDDPVNNTDIKLSSSSDQPLAPVAPYDGAPQSNPPQDSIVTLVTSTVTQPSIGVVESNSAEPNHHITHALSKSDPLFLLNGLPPSKHFFQLGADTKAVDPNGDQHISYPEQAFPERKPIADMALRNGDSSVVHFLSSSINDDSCQSAGQFDNLVDPSKRDLGDTETAAEMNLDSETAGSADMENLSMVPQVKQEVGTGGRCGNRPMKETNIDALGKCARLIFQPMAGSHKLHGIAQFQTLTLVGTGRQAL